MAEQHEKIFGALGIPQEIIQEIESLTPEQLKDFKADKYVGSVKSSLKPGFETEFMNDNDFLNKIPEDKIPEVTRKKFESGQYTRFQKELIEAAKKDLGLTDEDLKDLSEEDLKSIKKTVVKISNQHLSKKGNVQGLQDMQKQVQDLTTKLETEKTAWEEKLTTETGKVTTAAQDKLIKAFTGVKLAGLEGVEYGVPIGYVTGPVLNKLSDKYSVILNANDELEIKQKDNKALDVLVEGKVLTFEQALKDTVLGEKLGKVKGAEDDGEKDKNKRKTIRIGEEGGSESVVELPSYIGDKIAKNQQLEK